MNIAVSFNRRKLNYAIVTLTSLCVNNPEHNDIFVLHSELEKSDLTKMAEMLHEFDVSISLVDILPDDIYKILYLDVDDIVHGSLKELYEADYDTSRKTEHQTYKLFARKAYEDGWTLEKVREKNKIINFDGNKPWEFNSTHFELEKLWWEYAAKTPIYRELMEELLENALSDQRLENEILQIEKDIETYKKTIAEVKTMIDKFSKA